MNKEKKVIVLTIAGFLVVILSFPGMMWLSAQGKPATLAFVPSACPVLKQIGVQLEPTPVGCTARGRFLPDLTDSGGKLIQGEKQIILSASQITAMVWE